MILATALMLRYMGQGIQERTKKILWMAFKKFRYTISLQIFQRLSSTNFTWSILEYLDTFFIFSNIIV